MAQESSINSVIPDEQQEGTTVIIDRKTGRLQYQTEDPVSERLTQQVGFNKVEGILNFVRGNGEVLPIPGFFTESQLGQGPRGSKGPRGKQGKDGRTGRDGKKGKTGCEGPVGAKGIIGDDGLDGDDGDRGITGLHGCPGVPGLTGLQGIPGIPGFQGPMGAAGPSCIVGPRGEVGPTPSGDVFYGSSEPPIEYYLWAVPTEVDVIQDPVEEPDAMSGTVSDESATMQPVTNDFFSGSLFMSLSGFSGGVGPFTYQWRWDAGTVDGSVIAVGTSGSRGRTLELTAYDQIDPQRTLTIEGEVWLEVTDTGNNDTLYRTERAAFTFTGTNNREDDGGEPDPGGPVTPPPGGGGGCIHQYTPVEMYDGTTRYARDVQVGDYIWGYAIEGVIDESQSNWRDWTTDDLRGQRTPVRVVVNQAATYSSYWIINSDLRITDEHSLLVEQNGVWKWLWASEMLEGDRVLGVDGPIEVVSLVKMDKEIRVAIFDVEDDDVYFAGRTPILVHNDPTFKKK
jgi:hypothetical protein